MNTNLPTNSSVQTDHDTGIERISIAPPAPYPTSWIAAIGFTAFLVPWAMAYPFLFRFLLGDLPLVPMKLFLLFWGVFWTLGGLLVGWMAFRLLRPTRPATLELDVNELRYDSGVAPPLLKEPQLRQLPPGTKHRDFFKRKRLRFSLADLQGLRLEEANNVTHLLIDTDDRPVAIATGADSSERRWIYARIKEKYGLRA